MLEYLFFNQRIADKFIVYLEQKGCDWQQSVDPMLESIIIRTPEDIEDELWDELDELHEKLSEEDQRLLEQNENEQSVNEAVDISNTAGIYIQLAGGKQTIARVKPDVVNRILDVISMDEFNTFIETIVSSVENPDDGPLCNKPG